MGAAGRPGQALVASSAALTEEGPKRRLRLKNKPRPQIPESLHPTALVMRKHQTPHDPNNPWTHLRKPLNRGWPWAWKVGQLVAGSLSDQATKMGVQPVSLGALQSLLLN